MDPSNKAELRQGATKSVYCLAATVRYECGQSVWSHDSVLRPNVY